MAKIHGAVVVNTERCKGFVWWHVISVCSTSRKKK